MCGIVATSAPATIDRAVRALHHRGPDHHDILTTNHVTLGHTRLAIQDHNPRSNQPYQAGNTTLTFNGEIFNAPELRAAVTAARPSHTWTTTGDTEALAWALDVLGPDQALPLADGMFALAWTTTTQPGTLHLARDRMGEIPLHVHPAQPVLAASELKAITALGRPARDTIPVGPGERWTITGDQITRRRWFQLTSPPDHAATLDDAAARVRSLLGRAVQRRSIADTPVCTLLSGGVDSAAITHDLTALNPNTTAYTAVFDPRSRDLRCARATAHHLGIRLIEVPIPSPTAHDLTHTVRTLEMPYKAQIEIGWACLHLAARIAADGHRVVFTGEGSDELWGSYGNAFFGIRDKGWWRYRRDLYAAQERKNFPRINKAFMSASVEARLPFADPDLVRYALSLPTPAVQDGASRPKAVLQRAYLDALPADITKRPKVAFQDGLGLKNDIARTLRDPRAHYTRAHRDTYG